MSCSSGNHIDTFIYKDTHKNPNKVLAEYSDTLKIFFDCGFNNDTLLLKSKMDTIFNEVLLSDEFFCLAKLFNIKHDQINDQFSVYMNGEFYGSIRLKRRFNEIHVDFISEKQKIIWKYHKYKFIYL